MGLALFGYVMAGAILLLTALASVNLLAAVRRGRDYRPVSPPVRTLLIGIAIWPIVVMELVKMFARQAPDGP